MTLYAASNLGAVIVPAESGGCGIEGGHSRPVINGAPQHPWALACPPCEDFLRTHNADQWSSTTVEIPETYDETKARENFEKRGAKDKDAILTLALARLAGIGSDELPESLTRMISGVPAHVPAELECPQGHGQPAGRKFCAECGSPMRGTAAAAALESPQKPEQAPAGGKPRRLRDARLDELQALARARTLDAGGNRADLIARLSEAGVTSNDLAAVSVAA
jgi:hypothetical protein